MDASAVWGRNREDDAVSVGESSCSGGYVGADQVMANGMRVGALADFSSGQVGDAYSSGEADGVGGLVYAEGSINPRAQILANIGGSSTDFSLRRRTQFGAAIGEWLGFHFRADPSSPWRYVQGGRLPQGACNQSFSTDWSNPLAVPMR